MAESWFMLTLVGEDKPGIVAAVSQALFENGINLGETSMLRLGGNFTIMMMVKAALPEEQLRTRMRAVLETQGMCLHVDPIKAHLHQHLLPNIQITVTGADRAGIVAQVTGALAAAGCNILGLESDVAGSDEQPVYIMQISAVVDAPVEAVEQALAGLRSAGIDVNVSPIETYIG